jgi:hypothetical protein
MTKRDEPAPPPAPTDQTSPPPQAERKSRPKLSIDEVDASEKLERKISA